MNALRRYIQQVVDQCIDDLLVCPKPADLVCGSSFSAPISSMSWQLPSLLDR